MYLKKVDIQGFKSFADKTEVEFKNEVTAIVGPNGSGKSNISDAIRWVLGEQSVKNLRGSKMEDIIFSGTDKRRALGYAEVTICFDNKSGKIPIDYSEVSVTRRMFRSGESEYYLNKNSCRLKDIRELFMDSGIGKDGYSIIGQGKIDEILSNKPEDRRSIFEEAAGIIKYKTKKEEAERKLEKTDNNIIRINDLVLEISNQKNILKNEAEKATEFIKLYSRLKDLEVSLYLRDIKHLDTQINETKKEKEKINFDLNIITQDKDLIEEKYNLLKATIQNIETTIEESRTIKFDTIQAFQKNKNQASILLEKESYLNKDLERLNREKVEVEVSISKLENSKIDLNIEKEKIDIELNKLKDESNSKNIALLELDNELLQFETILENEKNKTIHFYNNASDKRSEINSINSFKENTDKRMSQLRIEIQNINDNKEDLAIKIKELKCDETLLKENNKIELEQISKLNIERSIIEDKYKKNNEDIKENQIKLNGLNSSYHLYKNMEAGYEGYYKSVKSILQITNKDSNLRKGLIGVVADLLKVDSIYEKAIDISLGSNVQNVVVETEEDAKKFVNYLKNHRLGRATFLPISIIKGKSIKLNQLDKDEFNILGLSHELVKYEKRYHDIFEFLLGRTIVVKDIDNGIKLANKYGHIYRIVTLEGEVLNAGGSITGGSYGKDSISIINRRNKIDSLYQEISTINANLLHLDTIKVNLEQSLNSLNLLIDNKDSIVKSIDSKIYENLNTQNVYKNDSERLVDEITRKQEEILSLSKDLQNYNINKDNLDRILKEIEMEIEKAKHDVDLITIKVVELKNKRTDLDKELTDIKINLNSMEHSKNTLEHNSQNYSISKEQLTILLIDKKNSIISIQNEIESIASSRIEVEEEITKYEKIENSIALELNDLIKEKDKKMNSLYDEQDILKIIHKKILDNEKALNNLEIKLARYELQLENNYTKLIDEYELTIEEAIKFEKEIENIQGANNEVKELKDKIKVLGNVNISAIDEFKYITERLDFIMTQHKDLINAKENLKEIIKDMEKRMKTQFINSFKEINSNFTEVFSVLFNGGKAILELDDNDDILKSGIEITVQPPGKKLQSLSLLSGGEKSLTAVALLFAILKTKPSPFCILDEIDAALDEANINRYTNYLTKFIEKTQFILITHRKTTMEIADVLYGVTMEEEGVSKLISVKLKNNLVEAS